MAGKLTGLGATVSLANSSAVAKDVSNDVTGFTINTPFALQTVTGVDKSAEERLALVADATMTINGIHDYDADKLHKVVTTGQTTPRQIIITLLNGGTFTFTALLGTYTLTRAANGALTTAITASISNGTAGAWG